MSAASSAQRDEGRLHEIDTVSGVRRETAATGSSGRSWRRVIILAVVAGLAAWGWFGRESLLRGAAALWIISDPVSPADAIVVLGGNFHVRPAVAAEMYRRGLAGRILVSQTPEMDSLAIPSDAELNRAALLKLGVPAAAIETFGTASANTRDEAVALRQWAERNAASVFIIPAEIFGARRVRWILHREFRGTLVDLTVPAFEPPEYSRQDWWKSENGLIAFQNEILKYAYYRFKY